jgi:hypothetical protein
LGNGPGGLVSRLLVFGRQPGISRKMQGCGTPAITVWFYDDFDILIEGDEETEKALLSSMEQNEVCRVRDSGCGRTLQNKLD